MAGAREARITGAYAAASLTILFDVVVEPKTHSTTYVCKDFVTREGGKQETNRKRIGETNRDSENRRGIRGNTNAYCNMI